ncbi:non-canonical purine NTP diphosphatase [Niabella terrae]
MTLIFATNNAHKVAEVRDALHGEMEIISLKEAGIDQEIPEPHPSLQDNARQKARTIYELTGSNCFSEDTGLEVDALNGEPGVKSARYAEGQPQYKGIVDKLTSKMQGQTNRRARFRTVICLILEGNETLFEGICEGRITDSAAGSHGFGYDPVFIPEGADRTFAQMELSEKKAYSHRAKALTKLINHLKIINLTNN